MTRSHCGASGIEGTISTSYAGRSRPASLQLPSGSASKPPAMREPRALTIPERTGYALHPKWGTRTDTCAPIILGSLFGITKQRWERQRPSRLIKIESENYKQIKIANCKSNLWWGLQAALPQNFALCKTISNGIKSIDRPDSTRNKQRFLDNTSRKALLSEAKRRFKLF